MVNQSILKFNYNSESNSAGTRDSTKALYERIVELHQELELVQQAAAVGEDSDAKKIQLLEDDLYDLRRENEALRNEMLSFWLQEDDEDDDDISFQQEESTILPETISMMSYLESKCVDVSLEPEPKRVQKRTSTVIYQEKKQFVRKSPKSFSLRQSDSFSACRGNSILCRANSFLRSSFTIKAIK